MPWSSVLRLRPMMCVLGLATAFWFGLPRRALKRPKRPKLLPRRKPLRPKRVDQFSIMSWNVLADRYCRVHKNKYAYPSYTAWEVRWPQIKEELQLLNADIVCLQEVEPGMWDDYVAALPQHVGILQDKGKKREVVITNAVFYNPDKFTPCWVELRSRAMAVALSWNSCPEQVVYVANLHLEGHPLRPTDRMNQLYNILRRMQAHQESQGYEPKECTVIIAGDFNANANSMVCKLLSHGLLEALSTEAYLPQMPVTKKTLEQPYRLCNVYEEGDVELPFTTKMGTRRATIDFIWSTQNLQIDALYWPFKESFSWEAGLQFLPNANIPSDHVPIGAVFTQPQLAPTHLANGFNLNENDCLSAGNDPQHAVHDAAQASNNDHAGHRNAMQSNCDGASTRSEASIDGEDELHSWRNGGRAADGSVSTDDGVSHSGNVAAQSESDLSRHDHELPLSGNDVAPTGTELLKNGDVFLDGGNDDGQPASVSLRNGGEHSKSDAQVGDESLHQRNGMLQGDSSLTGNGPSRVSSTISRKAGGAELHSVEELRSDATAHPSGVHTTESSASAEIVSS